jgi:nucleotide-binding universal stress UspA family protein
MVYSHILVPLNISELDKLVIPFIEAIACIGLARRVTFIHIVEKVSIPPIYEPTSGRYVNLNFMLMEMAMSENIARASDYLKKLVESLDSGKTELNWQVLPAYDIVNSVSQFAVKNGVDFIIMASWGRTGLRHWIWGSVTHKVLKSVRVPGLILKVPIRTAFEKS